MNEACGRLGAAGDLFVGRAREPQKPIGLGFEGRDRYGPQPRAAADFLPAFRGVDIARADNGRRSGLARCATTAMKSPHQGMASWL